MKRTGILTLMVLLVFAPAFAEGFRWYKGNTHCHTTNSDGDASPEHVAHWYKSHGYNFVVITDHNFLTDTTVLDTDKLDDFILIPGNEISDNFNDTPVHLNALNLKKDIVCQHGGSITETLQNNIDSINAAGAIPQINHPNWLWSFADKEMSPLKNVRLFELYNFSYNCNNFGAGGYPGMEEIWDRMLSKGMVMYGVASDDAHDYLTEFSPIRSNPGTGWIMVRADELTPEAITSAMVKGHFYATTGVLLKNIVITEKEYVVEIEPVKHMKYTTTFIGKNGKVLEEVYGNHAVYTFKEDEFYVRARIFASSGEFACTQPHFLKNK